MKKIILTKGRLSALNAAISLDDVLYEKYRRMEDSFQKQVRKWHRENQVTSVIKVGGKFAEKLQIVKETKTGDGIYLEVR